jgi:hypothetical protein
MYFMKNKLKIYTMQLDYNTMQCIIPNPGWGGGGGGGGPGAGSTRAQEKNNLRPLRQVFVK